MQRASTRFFIFTLILFTPTHFFGEGFRAGTLVATPSGLCPIEKLLPGDRVISRTKTGEETQALITAVSKKLTMDVRKLVVAGESALVDKNQKFYVANKRGWSTVDTLSAGDELVSPDGHKICVEDVHECDKELTTLYRLTVAHHHNFCIGQSKLVAHNVTGAELVVVPVAQGGAAALTAAAEGALAIFSGTGLVISFPVACVAGGTAVAGYGIYSLVQYKKNKHKSRSASTTPNTNNRSSNGQESPRYVYVRGIGEFTDKEINQWREELGRRQQPINTGACLPETKPVVTPADTCTIEQNQIEKERLLGPVDTNAALDPENIPQCGRQGQTLPGLGSGDITENVPKDESRVEGETVLGEPTDVLSHELADTTSDNTVDVNNKTLDSAVAPENSTFIPAHEVSLSNSIAIVSGLVQTCDDLQDAQKKSKKDIKIPTQQEIEESKSIEDRLLEGTTKSDETKGKSTIYIKDGSYDKALEDFSSIDLKNIFNTSHGLCGTLPDGRRVNVRSKSKDARPTLEFYNPTNGRMTKIRYE